LLGAFNPVGNNVGVAFCKKKKKKKKKKNNKKNSKISHRGVKRYRFLANDYSILDFKWTLVPNTTASHFKGFIVSGHPAQKLSISEMMKFSFLILSVSQN
jgi:hypothetical protein